MAATPTVEHLTTSPTEIIRLSARKIINNCYKLRHKLSQPLFYQVLTTLSDDSVALRKNKPIFERKSLKFFGPVLGPN